jgi:hypothetical protein
VRTARKAATASSGPKTSAGGFVPGGSGGLPPPTFQESPVLDLAGADLARLERLAGALRELEVGRPQQRQSYGLVTRVD